MVALVACTSDQTRPGASAAQTLDAKVSEQFEITWRKLLSRSAPTRKSAIDAIARTWSLHRARVAARANGAPNSDRFAASFLFSRLGTLEDLPVLRKYLDDPIAGVRAEAIKGLLRLEDVSSASAIVKLVSVAGYEELQQLMQALETLSPAHADPLLYDLASHQKWASRRVAAQSAGRRTSKRSLKMLVALIDDEVWMVRADAIQAIGKRRCHVALDKIRACARDESSRVRAESITTLGTLGHTRDFQLAKRLALKDGNQRVRSSAIRSLKGFPAKVAIPVLEQVLGNADEDNLVRRDGLLTFLEIADPDSRSRLTDLIVNGDRALKELARTTLGFTEKSAHGQVKRAGQAAAGPGR